MDRSTCICAVPILIQQHCVCVHVCKEKNTIKKGNSNPEKKKYLTKDQQFRIFLDLGVLDSNHELPNFQYRLKKHKKKKKIKRVVDTNEQPTKKKQFWAEGSGRSEEKKLSSKHIICFSMSLALFNFIIILGLSTKLHKQKHSHKLKKKYILIFTTVTATSTTSSLHSCIMANMIRRLFFHKFFFFFFFSSLLPDPSAQNCFFFCWINGSMIKIKIKISLDQKNKKNLKMATPSSLFPSIPSKKNSLFIYFILFFE